MDYRRRFMKEYKILCLHIRGEKSAGKYYDKERLAQS